MRKIPTLFIRDSKDMRRLTRERHPDALWVGGGPAVPTRKYDGTCLMIDGAENWWARREVKPGKASPPHFQPIETDPETDKTVGWEPIDQSPFVTAWQDAMQNPETNVLAFGTYELIGPKVNGNPEGRERHELVMHDMADDLGDVPTGYDDLRDWLADFDGEGVVWHHPDGRMAKIKRKDFWVPNETKPGSDG